MRRGFGSFMQANVPIGAVSLQPGNVPPGVLQPDLVLPRPGGGETEQAFFILENEAAGASDPTRQTFTGPPYEAHRDDGTIEYIGLQPSATRRPWWQYWLPPLALAGLLGAAYMVLRRPSGRRRK